MAVIKEITTSGQSSVSTLSGSIRLEEGRGRLVVYDSITSAELTVIDRDGLKTYDETNEEVVRSGKMPDSSYGFTAAKPGETIQTIYG